MLSSGAGPYGAQIDRRRIVAAGHSYGANTALLAVGARVMREGQWVEARDPRFAAAIVISAPPFYGESDLASVLSKITVPSLHVTATNDVIEIPGYYSPAADRLNVFNAIATPRKLLAVFEGGSHSIFTDRAFTGGPALNPKVKAATAELTLAFLLWLRREMGGSSDAKPDGCRLRDRPAGTVRVVSFLRQSDTVRWAPDEVTGQH